MCYFHEDIDGLNTDLDDLDMTAQGSILFDKNHNIPEFIRAFIPDLHICKKGKRKVQGVPQSQTAALPRPKEEKETNKSKQAQTKQTYEKH